jgi:SAM-dependent methyltransferase
LNGSGHTALAYRLPQFIRNHVLHFEASIEAAVETFAHQLPTGASVLDAGAGESRHAPLFAKQHYVAVDLAVGDTAWNYRKLDCVADLAALPFHSAAFDALINIVTLEHLPDPARALNEMARVLRPGARVLIAAPHEWEVHQSPHDFFRYTRHGLEHLLSAAGFVEIEIKPVGGYFRLLSRRLLNGLQFFVGGPRWLLFLPAAALLVPPALLLPALDGLDRDKNFTLGYLCTAKRSSS